MIAPIINILNPELKSIDQWLKNQLLFYHKGIFYFKIHTFLTK